MSIGLVLESHTLHGKQSTLDTLRATLATKQTVEVHPTPGAQYAEEKSQRLAVLATALTGRVAWDRVLGEIGRVLPKNVWLSGLTLKAPTSPTAPPVVAPSSPSLPTGVMIQGYTYSQEDVARTL